MHSSKHGRRYYLTDIPLEEAKEKFWSALQTAEALRPSGPETIPLDQALGRITAAAVWAKVSSPHYNAAAMDGIAVRARDTIGATETAPVRLQVPTQARWLDTGDPLPPDYDAVIMVEALHEIDASTVEVQSPVVPYQHVRPLGEDIVASELVLPENHRLRPHDLAACAAAGLSELPVRKRPRVAVIPTGSELVPLGSELKPGDIIESNSLMLGAMIDEWGGEPVRWPSIPDDYARLRSEIPEAIDSCDIVVVNAGSSAGSEDYTARLVEELGDLLVHGVALRPGHPVVLGLVDKTPFLGIPGYPVSAALTCEIFVKPLVERMLGVRGPERNRLAATLGRKVSSPIGEDEFLRVRLGKVADRLIATPVQRGAGVIMSLVRADGLVKIPRFSEGLEAGQEVAVELLRPDNEIEGTIVVTGSHDLTLDLLASLLHATDPALSLSSSNIGSMGGLVALSRGEAHLAGSHLLDEETGEYNLSFVRRYVKDRDLVVMNLVQRVQGLIVPSGNPKNISSFKDLDHDDLRFVNRQRGSGTRVLLDYKLKEAGMSPDQVQGYDREEYTHLAVAAAVAGRTADVGLGILSAARAMGLGFVPLLTEQYDLVIPREFYEATLLHPLLQLVRGENFRAEVKALGGYDTSMTGRVVAELSGHG